MDATIDGCRYSEGMTALEMRPSRIRRRRQVRCAGTGRRGHVRRVVRLPGRTDPGAAAARGRQPPARHHRRRAGRGAGHRPAHRLPPRPQARRRRVRDLSTRTAPAPSSRSTRPAAPASRTPPTPSWACSPRAPAARRPARRRDRPPDARGTGTRSPDLRRRHRHPHRHLRHRSPHPGHSDAKWLPDHRWVAEIDGRSSAGPRSARCPSGTATPGVAENSVYVADGMRGRGVGKALLRNQVIAADDGRPLDLADLDLPGEPRQHRPAPLRRLPHLGVRERIAQLDGIWRDTVFLERRP